MALTKLLRDAISAKPKTGGGDSVWKNRVLAIRDIVNMLMIGRVSAETAVKKIEGLNSAAAERFRLYKDLGYPAFLKAKDYRIDEVNYYSDPWIVRKGRKVVEKYPTYEEAVNALRDRLTNAENQRRETKFDIYQYRTTKEIVIGKKVGTGRYVDLKKGFKNWREAAEYINAHREELEEGLKRAKEVRESRGETNEERTGKQWREDISVSPEEFLKTFGFRGVQFGNYIGQDMRSKNLNEAYDALLDLSDVLNIPSQAISLDGTLGLAFGARGSGGKNAAAAHYEAKQVVINLTKKNGAGNLAHEWWHALDNYFGAQKSFDRETADKNAYMTLSGRTTAHRREMKEAFDNVVKAVKDSEMFTRSKRRDQARAAPYWSSEKEMTARAFETYVKDRLAEKGTKNDFLVNIIDTGTVIEESDYEYPTKSERIKIDEAFDRLFNTMQTEPTETGYRLYQTVEPFASKETVKNILKYKPFYRRAAYDDYFTFPNGRRIRLSEHAAFNPRSFANVEWGARQEETGVPVSDKDIERIAAMPDVDMPPQHKYRYMGEYRGFDFSNLTDGQLKTEVESRGARASLPYSDIAVEFRRRGLISREEYENLLMREGNFGRALEDLKKIEKLPKITVKSVKELFGSYYDIKTRSDVDELMEHLRQKKRRYEELKDYEKLPVETGNFFVESDTIKEDGNDTLYQTSDLTERAGGPEIAADSETVEVVEIPENAVPKFKTKKELVRFIKDILGNERNITIKSTGEKVLVSNAGINRAAAKTRRQEYNTAFAAVKHLLENAKYSGFVATDERHPNVKGQDLYHSGIVIGGKPYSVAFKIDIPLENGSYNYAGHIIADIEIAPSENANGYFNSPQTNGAIHTISMGVLRGKVNPARLSGGGLSQRKTLRSNVIKGSFDPSEKIIRITKNADFSTLPHEFAHYWLTMQKSWLDSGAASEAYQERMRIALDWMNVKPWKSIGVRAQEKFARGYEQYLLKGDLPESPLNPVFKEYDKWLKEVYNGANKPQKEPLTSDMVRFFDSMTTGVLDPPVKTPLNTLPEDKEGLEKPATGEETGENTGAASASLPASATENTVPVRSFDTAQESDARTGRLSRALERRKKIAALQGKIEEDAVQSTYYTPMTLEEQATRAYSLMQNEGADAVKDMIDGLRDTPDDVMRVPMMIAYEEEMLRQGNLSEYSRVLKKHTLEQTRRGQEIVSEKLAGHDISDLRYWFKRVLSNKKAAAVEKFKTLFQKDGGEKAYNDYLRHIADKTANAVVSAKDEASRRSILNAALREAEAATGNKSGLSKVNVSGDGARLYDRIYDAVSEELDSFFNASLSVEETNRLFEASMKLKTAYDAHFKQHPNENPPVEVMRLLKEMTDTANATSPPNGAIKHLKERFNALFARLFLSLPDSGLAFECELSFFPFAKLFPPQRPFRPRSPHD